MKKFQIYTYMFRPVMEQDASLLFEDFEEVDVNESLANKQDIFGDIADDDVHLNFANKKGAYGHRTYLNQGGIIVMRIANNKRMRVEKDFSVASIDNKPSALVIIDNRKDRQVIAIECCDAFAKTSTLASIIEMTFNRHLAKWRLAIDVRARYSTAEFWQVVRDSDLSQGIDYVVFPFPYPNLPAISNMLGHYMADMARRTNSEPSLHLKAQDSAGVRLDENDLVVMNAIKACAASGRPILIKPKGMALRKIGIKSGVTEEISEVAFEDLEGRSLFDSKLELIVAFLNKIKLVYE